MAESRDHASGVGAHPPTGDASQFAAEAGLRERAKPRAWNWRAEGSVWPLAGGTQDPAFSLELLLIGPPERPMRVGFRPAVDR